MLRNRYNKNDLGVSFAVVTLAVIAVSIIAAIVSQIFHIALDNNVFVIAVNAINTLVIGSTAFIYAKITRTNVVSATKMKVKPPLSHIGWGCAATLCLITFMTPLNGWIADGIEALGLPRPSVDINMDIVSMVIVAAVLPAFCEEIIFRGTIAQSLEGNKNKLASLAAVGGLFAIFHMNPAQTVHQFVLGAFLALLMYRSGSLWTSVIVHFFNNIVVIALSAIFGEKLDLFFEQNAIWLFFAGLIGFAGCVAGYMFTTKSKWETDAEQTKISGGSIVMLSVALAVCAANWLMTLFMQN